MHNLAQRVSLEGLGNSMDVIGHHRPCVQTITLAVKIAERIGNQIRNGRVVHMADAMTGIQEALDLLRIQVLQPLLFVFR